MSIDFGNDIYEDPIVAKTFLAEDAGEKTVELTLNLSYQNEQWWILCDEALVNAVSGGVLN